MIVLHIVDVWLCGCGPVGCGCGPVGYGCGRVGCGLPLGRRHILTQPVHPLLRYRKEMWNEEERELSMDKTSFKEREREKALTWIPSPLMAEHG